MSRAGDRWKGHYRPDLAWEGPNVVEPSIEWTMRWLAAHVDAEGAFLDDFYDIGCLPLPLKHAAEAVTVALEQARPLFNGALALPPAERLRATRAPRYFELLEVLASAEMQLVVAIWAARTAAVSAWLRGEGEPQETQGQEQK